MNMLIEKMHKIKKDIIRNVLRKFSLNVIFPFFCALLKIILNNKYITFIGNKIFLQMFSWLFRRIKSFTIKEVFNFIYLLKYP